MKRPILTDAQLMAATHPATFEAPTGNELAFVLPGSSVKVATVPSAPGAPSERFWVEVVATCDSGLVGRIDNDLVFTQLHGLRCDDLIEFERRHIYQILDDQPNPKAMQ